MFKKILTTILLIAVGLGAKNLHDKSVQEVWNLVLSDSLYINTHYYSGQEAMNLVYSESDSAFKVHLTGGIVDTVTALQDSIGVHRTAINLNTAKTGVTTEISNLSEDTTPELGGDLDAGEYRFLNSPDLTELGREQEKAYWFDGDDDLIDFGNIDSIKSLIIRINPNSTTESIFEEIDNVGVSISSGTVSYPSWDNCYIDGKDTDIITTGWHNIALTSTTNIDASAFRFGLVNTTYFNGSNCLILPFNKELTQSEIQEIQNHGVPYKYQGASQTEQTSGT
ncbi:MAG: hypothetical protein U9P63_02475, partial [Patescibacteria group bacterium]|nr:hypothetical protein [Patescibacteria group bacterium]